jgi:hypothetical protein
VLEPVKNPWKGLRETLNAIIAAVNKNQVVAGTGLAIDTASPNGTVVSAVSASQSRTAAAAGSTGSQPPNNAVATWQLLDVVIETDTGYTVKQIYAWSTPLQ